MKNLENIKLVLDHIENNPECWQQTNWHCGTSHCFAGWAQVLSGKEENDATVRRDARMFFGFNRQEADYYFHGDRKLEELKTALLDEFYNDGYNQYGLDRDGYNRNGYNSNGFDRDGFNFDGFNFDGFDKDGFDRDGLDKNNKYKFFN